MGLKSKIKRFFHNRWAALCRTWHYVAIVIPFVIVALCIASIVASVIRIHTVLDGQTFQYRAEYFGSSKMSYRHLTVLALGLEQEDGSAPRSRSGGLNTESVKQLHDELDNTERSNNGSDARSQALLSSIENLWMDCYSSSAVYSAKGFIDKVEQGSVDSAEIVGVGGYYGAIHPFRFESGGFLQPEDGDRYAIVLNTQLAWNLFHSYDVLGALVEIANIRYEVVGVVCEGDDAIAEATGVTKPRAYVEFSELAHLINGPVSRKGGQASLEPGGEGSGTVEEQDLAVTCYEVLLTDPIKNIAYNDLIKVMGDTIGYSQGTSTSMEVINNTGRFNVLTLYKKFFPLKNTVDGNINGIKVPYQERSARLAEQYVVFWAEVLIVSGLMLIVGLCGVYSTLHGRKTKHAIVYVDEDEEIPEIHRV